MISVELARELQAAGLSWVPARYDVFFIPDRELDDRVFVLADMTIDVQHLAGGAAITFNGAVEWSLDSILHADVVWLPTEAQLRGLLGERLVSLTREGALFECTVEGEGERLTYRDEGASNAYAMALLALMDSVGYQPRLPERDAVGPFGRQSRPQYARNPNPAGF